MLRDVLAQLRILMFLELSCPYFFLSNYFLDLLKVVLSLIHLSMIMFF